VKEHTEEQKEEASGSDAEADPERVETAGTIEVEIPAVVSPDGRVSAALSMNKSGKEVTDVGVLYDAWYDEQSTPLALVKVRATIDLDEVFKERFVEGSVETREDES
jgi:hypothetical protein